MVSFLGLPPKYYKLSDLKQHKFISPQFWRLAVQDQSVSKAVLLLRLLGEDLSSSSFSCLLAILGLQIHHPVSVTLITWRPSLCASLCEGLCSDFLNYKRTYI